LIIRPEGTPTEALRIFEQAWAARRHAFGGAKYEIKGSHYDFRVSRRHCARETVGAMIGSMNFAGAYR
jgi:hypothetical protein